MDNEDAVIGQRVQKLRNERGMTTTTLAQLVGISQAQISRLETGKQGFRSATLRKLAEALEVEPYYLFLGDGLKTPTYGLVKSTRLRRALRSADFTDLADRLAELFLEKKKVFKSVRDLVSHL